MTPARLIEIPVVFYRSAGGAEPVREWLRSLPAQDRRVIGGDLATLQVGWPMGMPLCRALGAGFVGDAEQSAEQANGATVVFRGR